jgi:hypothetical protein
MKNKINNEEIIFEIKNEKETIDWKKEYNSLVENKIVIAIFTIVKTIIKMLKGRRNEKDKKSNQGIK